MGYRSPIQLMAIAGVEEHYHHLHPRRECERIAEFVAMFCGRRERVLAASQDSAAAQSFRSEGYSTLDFATALILLVI